MERLTQRIKTGEVLMASEYEEKYTIEEWICVLQDRLAAYEDTGLMPEELQRAFVPDASIKLAAQALGTTPERLRELAAADKDGRVVVLPCKVGATVYKVITIQAQKSVMLETQVKTLGQAADVAQLIGKKNKVINIFLTREEAERAMEGQKHD